MEDALGVKRKERVPRAGIGLAGYISLILVPYREEGSKGGRSLGRRNARATNHIPPPSIFIRWVDGHPSTTEGPRRLRMRENIGSNVPIPTWGGTRRGGTKKCGMTNVRLSAECRWRGGVWGAGPGALALGPHPPIARRRSTPAKRGPMHGSPHPIHHPTCAR